MPKPLQVYLYTHTIFEAATSNSIFILEAKVSV